MQDLPQKVTFFSLDAMFMREGKSDQMFFKFAGRLDVMEQNRCANDVEIRVKRFVAWL